MLVFCMPPLLVPLDATLAYDVAAGALLEGGCRWVGGCCPTRVDEHCMSLSDVDSRELTCFSSPPTAAGFCAVLEPVAVRSPSPSAIVVLAAVGSQPPFSCLLQITFALGPSGIPPEPVDPTQLQTSCQRCVEPLLLAPPTQQCDVLTVS
jgi:hypothetical protein